MDVRFDSNDAVSIMRVECELSSVREVALELGMYAGQSRSSSVVEDDIGREYDIAVEVVVLKAVDVLSETGREAVNDVLRVRLLADVRLVVIATGSLQVWNDRVNYCHRRMCYLASPCLWSPQSPIQRHLSSLCEGRTICAGCPHRSKCTISYILGG